MHFWKHFKTITHHKLLVMQGCFKIGLILQGITHDLSKYTPTEFMNGIKYFQGNRSPNAAEREDKGYSEAWLHHKGRNKHHYEYWMDYSMKETASGMAPAQMPVKYVIEMFMDRIAASKVYQRESYTNRSPLEYYMSGIEKAPMLLHPVTRKQLEKLLHMLAEHGEAVTFAYIRKRILKRKQ